MRQEMAMMPRAVTQIFCNSMHRAQKDFTICKMWNANYTTKTILICLRETDVELNDITSCKMSKCNIRAS